MTARCALVAALGLALVSLPAPLAAQAEWAVDVVVTTGPLTVGDATPLLRARLGVIADCAPGAGPYRLVYSVSVGASGGVRGAAPDRSAGADLAPPRAVRCVRHALEELELPERSEASELVVTFSTGASSAPAASAPAASAPAASAPAASAPAPGRHPGSPAPSAVTVGPIPSAPGRPSASLGVVVEAGRSALSSCYANALSAAPEIAGTGTLHLTIEPDGRVLRALFAGGEALASAMALCLGTAARSWAFGAASESARIDVPLTFATP